MPTKSTRNAPNPTDARARVRVRLQLASRSRRIPRLASFRVWVRAAVLATAQPAGHAAIEVTVTIRLVGTQEARRLNFAYRGLDYATNVLTFAYAPAEGDIVICPQVLAREARAQGKALDPHYAHLTVHAILHLRGYDHARPADAARMERVEIRILKQLGYSNPYLL